MVLSLCALDENTFASSGGDKQIHICTATRQLLQTLSGHTDWVWHVIKLTEDVIVSCSEDQTIRIWHLKTGKVVTEIRESSPVHCLAFDPDTYQLISGGYSGEIKVRKLAADFTHWTIETNFQAHTGIIRTLVLREERFVISGGEDNKVRIWDLPGASLLAEINHTNFVQSLVVTPDHRLISASYDGQIKVSNLPPELVT